MGEGRLWDGTLGSIACCCLLSISKKACVFFMDTFSNAYASSTLEDRVSGTRGSSVTILMVNSTAILDIFISGFLLRVT